MRLISFLFAVLLFAIYSVSIFSVTHKSIFEKIESIEQRKEEINMMISEELP